MNIEEYIASGILEAYAAGLLSEKEREEVLQHVLTYPPLQHELSKIEAAQEVFVQRVAVPPPVGGKEKLLGRIATTHQAKVIQLSATTNTFWKYAVAASLTLALITSFLAHDYRQKWVRSVISFNDLMTRNQQLAQDYSTVSNRITTIETDLGILNNPAFTRIVLAGTANAPDAQAVVYWNAQTREVYLSLQNMRELAAENQYQLWAIIDGQPVDTGLFDGTLEGLLKMKELHSTPTAFAVTIEARGGRTSPTLATMQVVGNV